MINMTLNYTTLREALIDVLQVNLVPFITGSPGIGKSSIIKSIADEFNLELIDFRLTTAEPVDLQGMPNFTQDGKAYYAPFDVFPLETDPLPKGKDGWILFCHHADTEVLTKDSGFVKFSELSKSEKIVSIFPII